MLPCKGDATPDKLLLVQYGVVHEFRKLNDNTAGDSHLMKNMHELLDAVANSHIWSIFELSSGFWSQQLAEKSKPYTLLLEFPDQE